MKFPFQRGGLQALSGHRVSNTDGPAYTAILLLRLSQARGIERRRRTTGAVRPPLPHLASTPVGHSSSNSDEQPSETPEGEGGYEGRGDEGIPPQWTDFGRSLGGNQANETVRLVKLAAGIHEFPRQP